MYTYMIKLWSGKLIYIDADDQESALKAAGLTMLDVKRMMPIAYLNKLADQQREEQDRKTRRQIQDARDRKLREKYGLDSSFRRAAGGDNGR